MFWSSIWKKSNPDAPRRGFLIVLGTVITAIWFAGGLIYIFQSARYVSLLSSFEALGAFLEGFFAPLAFLWLVIGLFMQQREIAFNSKVVQRNSRNAEAQTKVLEATELRARQSSFFQIAESVKNQLRNLVGTLVESCFGPAGDGSLSREELDEMWQQRRDTAEIFCWSLERKRIHEHSTDDELRELYFGNRERTVISEEYVRSFRGLLKLAADCDLDGTISRSVIQTPLGLVYLNMLKSMKPPSVWILLDELDPLHAIEPYSMTEGKWLVTGSTLRGSESWNVTLTRGSDGEISGSLYSDGVEVSFDETAISGTAFFAKFTIAENFFIVTARATDKGMSGTIDYDGGLYGSFVGEKAALESHD